MTKIHHLKKNSRSKILSLMLVNFFIWLIPGIIIFALSLAIILALMFASAVIDTKLNFQKWPKGLVSFLGISYLLAGVVFLVLIFTISGFDSEIVVALLCAALTSWVLAYLMLKAEWKRLSKIK